VILKFIESLQCGAIVPHKLHTDSLRSKKIIPEEILNQCINSKRYQKLMGDSGKKIEII
jgi:hypothetical protein